MGFRVSVRVSVRVRVRVRARVRVRVRVRVIVRFRVRVRVGNRIGLPGELGRHVAVQRAVLGVAAVRRLQVRGDEGRRGRAFGLSAPLGGGADLG